MCIPTSCLGQPETSVCPAPPSRPVDRFRRRHDKVKKAPVLNKVLVAPRYISEPLSLTEHLQTIRYNHQFESLLPSSLSLRHHAVQTGMRNGPPKPQHRGRAERLSGCTASHRISVASDYLELLLCLSMSIYVSRRLFVDYRTLT